MIQRLLHTELAAWLNNRDESRNVLLLEGARQVGKTTLVRAVADDVDRPMVYINLEEQRRIRAEIELLVEFSDFERYLSHTFGFSGDGSKILCIDEAQECPVIGSFVRFMKEQWHATPVVLTGSSMTRIFKNTQRFPVGRVRRMLLQPYSFREFLRAANQESLLEIPDPLSVPEYQHTRLLRKLQDFCDVGGLPGIVSEFVSGNDWRQTRQDLFLDYKDDFIRIFSEEKAGLFDSCLRGVSSNLGHPSLYSQMVKTSSPLYRKVPDFLTLLEHWKIIHMATVHSPDPKTQQYAPKRYLYDIGMAAHLRLTALPRIDILDQIDANQRQPLGGLAENLLATEMIGARQELHAWKQAQNSFEVDFVYKSSSGETIPVECKASLKTKSSHTEGLAAYCLRHGVNRALLVNFAPPARWKNNAGITMTSLPLYMAERIPEIADLQ